MGFVPGEFDGRLLGCLQHGVEVHSIEWKLDPSYGFPQDASLKQRMHVAVDRLDVSPRELRYRADGQRSGGCYHADDFPALAGQT